ncbi:hypothetical protein ACJMK2_011563 [Sinanodonta woodiana]|uniref:Uncharacterized protein n=1 Tax=Sinanodonta woodiana TaxID=1069815 RepID=A0ABD3V8K6_SINWO
MEGLSTSFRKPKNRLVAKTLADYAPDAMEKKVKKKETSHSKIQIAHDSAQRHTSSQFDNSKYRQLGHLLELERSKDPEWAFICMMGLMLLLAICCYCCRLSRITRKHEIHVDFEERFHFVSLKDILKGKKRFLPMFKKKKPKRKYRQLKEVDLANLHSDTSEEELMLYDTSHQTHTGPDKKPRT